MIDAAEFDRGWALLQAAMPEIEFPESTRALYASLSRGFPAGSFVAGVTSLITSPDFDTRHLVSLHELRDECLSAVRPKGVPHVGGVPLGRVLDALEPREDGPAPDPEEAAELVPQIAARTQKLLPAPPGPGNADHRALLRLMPTPREPMGDAEWEDRRRRVLEQADELLGAGEPA